jgi:hypothetical protein
LCLCPLQKWIGTRSCLSGLLLRGSSLLATDVATPLSSLEDHKDDREESHTNRQLNFVAQATQAHRRLASHRRAPRCASAKTSYMPREDEHRSAFRARRSDLLWEVGHRPLDRLASYRIPLPTGLPCTSSSNRWSIAVQAATGSKR